MKYKGGKKTPVRGREAAGHGVAGKHRGKGGGKKSHWAAQNYKKSGY